MKQGIGECFTPNDEKLIMNLFNNACFNCGSNKSLQIDHIYPLSLGNPLTLQNASVLCINCNSSKGNKNPIEFFGNDKFNSLINILRNIGAY